LIVFHLLQWNLKDALVPDCSYQGLDQCFSTFCCSGIFRKCLRCSWNPMPGFSNYGSRPQLGSRNVILGPRKKLAWQVRYKTFCKLYKKF